MDILSHLPLVIVAALIFFDIWASIYRRNLGWHSLADTGTNIAIACINLVIRNLFWYAAFFWIAGRVFDHRLWSMDESGMLNWVGLFLLVDFVAYFRHRIQHRVRILWAVHVVHHSSLFYNHTTDLRSSVLAEWCRIPTLLIFPWLGFSPTMLLTVLAAYQVYDTFNHNQYIGKLGFFEKLFVTPSHHRVHHGSNAPYIDRNYSTFFIVWDHLFGTFSAEEETVVYGTTTPIKTHNIFKIYFGEFLAIFRDVKQARSLREALLLIFGPPEWRPK